jgi:hypothetical protein
VRQGEPPASAAAEVRPSESRCRDP